MNTLFEGTRRRSVSLVVLTLGMVALLGSMAAPAQAALFNFNWESGDTSATEVGLHGGYHVSVPSNAAVLTTSPAPKATPPTRKTSATTYDHSPTRGILTIRPKAFRLPMTSTR
jgi:hypothetical protein